MLGWLRKTTKKFKSALSKRVKAAKEKTKDKNYIAMYKKYEQKALDKRMKNKTGGKTRKNKNNRNKTRKTKKY